MPAGRLSVEEVRHVADLPIGIRGRVRLTVEQNFILPNVDAEKTRFAARTGFNDGPAVGGPGNVKGPMVSCTGSQFCPLAIIRQSLAGASCRK